jgi:CRP/FNR family transcriptional regulator, cyclic AMP receptor protein
MKAKTETTPIKRSTPAHSALRTPRPEVITTKLHTSSSTPLAPARSGFPKGLFSYLSSKERLAFLAQCSERRLPRNATIFSQDQRHTTFLIKEGVVRTYYVSPGGREATLAYWSAGNLIGGPYFFDDQRKNIWSAQTVEDSILLAIEGARLQQLAASMPALASFLIDSLSFKLHWVSLLLQAMGTEFIHCRLATLLLHLSELYGEKSADGIVIRYHFTQGDLGAMVGATRQWVSTALGRLQRDGIVRLQKRRLHILDIERLTALTVSS